MLPNPLPWRPGSATSLRFTVKPRPSRSAAASPVSGGRLVRPRCGDRVRPGREQPHRKRPTFGGARGGGRRRVQLVREPGMRGRARPRPLKGRHRKLGGTAGQPSADRWGALPPIPVPPQGGLRPPRPPEGSRSRARDEKTSVIGAVKLVAWCVVFEWPERNPKCFRNVRNADGFLQCGADPLDRTHYAQMELEQQRPRGEREARAKAMGPSEGMASPPASESEAGQARAAGAHFWEICRLAASPGAPAIARCGFARLATPSRPTRP